MLRVFEAFAGIGAQRMALRNINLPHEIVAISEIDKFALASYEAVHGKVNNLGDITTIDIEDVPKHDLFTYSFPCQDISVAGSQKGLDESSNTRSGLLWHCKKIIEHKKPKYLLLENVKNLIGKRHRENFLKWVDWLDEQGYSNYWQVLNAKDYNIPQNRERVFLVSVLGEHETFEFPQKQELKTCLCDVLESEVDERYFLSEEQIKKIQFSTYNAQKRRIQEKEFCDTLCARDYKDAKCIKLKQIGQQIAPKLTTVSWMNNNFLYHRERVRKLTPLEYWRLMGFSDEDFYKAQAVNSNSQLYKQAGNSIVVNVLEAIFKQLFKKELMQLQQEKTEKVMYKDNPQKQHKQTIKCELYNDHHQNYKRYSIPKAQLVIADIPYNLSKNAYASSPEWYINGDNRQGESDKANKAFFDTDHNFKIAEFMHFCSKMLKKEPKETNQAPAMIVFCSFQQIQMIIEYGKKYGFMHHYPLVFIKKSSAQVLKANMKIVGATEYAVVLYRDKLPKFRNKISGSETGEMIKNWFNWETDDRRKYPKLHPTQKPVKLLKRLIKIFTDEGDVVIDPCAGSGTTLRAARELGRHSYGFEIKKDMCIKANEEMLTYNELQSDIFDFI